MRTVIKVMTTQIQLVTDLIIRVVSVGGTPRPHAWPIHCIVLVIWNSTIRGIMTMSGPQVPLLPREWMVLAKQQNHTHTKKVSQNFHRNPVTTFQVFIETCFKEVVFQVEVIWVQVSAFFLLIWRHHLWCLQEKPPPVPSVDTGNAYLFIIIIVRWPYVVGGMLKLQN